MVMRGQFVRQTQNQKDYLKILTESLITVAQDQAFKRNFD